MNAHVRLNFPRLAFSAQPTELWTGTVRLVGKEPPDEFRVVKWHLFARARANPPAAPRNPQVILVTSAGAEEGKTYVARNLVVSLALDADSEVTLIDANFGNPGLPSANLRGTYHPGLLDILSGEKSDTENCYLESNRPNVHLLPGGKPRTNTSELLTSERMQRLLGQMTSGGPNRFVVIDGGSLLGTTEAALIAQYCGHVLFVAAEKKTRKMEIDRSLALLEQLAWPVDNDSLSFVLNRLPK
jgi:receptor protein-tyrosine kinase